MLILCQDIPKCYTSLHFLESCAYILLVTAWFRLRLSNGWECIAIRWEKGCSIRTAAEGSLLPPEWTLPAAAHPAGALEKAQLGTQVNLSAQCPTAPLVLVAALGNGWQRFCVLFCGISGLSEAVGFLPPSCRTHSRTPAHASLRKFFMIHAEIFPCWVLPPWTS